MLLPYKIFLTLKYFDNLFKTSDARLSGPSVYHGFYLDVL